MKNRFLCVYIVAVIFLLIGSSAVHAAVPAILQLTADKHLIAIGDLLHVDISLDTNGEDINAIKADVFFPANQFSLSTISTGASIISFWVEPPHEVSPGHITLSGIVPGGFQGKTSPLVSFSLTPLVSGTGTIALANVTILRNDGQGSSVSVESRNEIITVTSSTRSSPPPPEKKLFTPPEPFTPVISHDAGIFDGKYFLAFSTTDKESGIDHYEVLENSAWEPATSPFLLEDQSLSHDIYVRAVSRTGSFIIVKVPARFPVSPQSPNNLPVSPVVILIIAALVLVYVLYKGGIL